MKKPKLTYKNITAILFSVIIFFFLFTIGERFVRSSILHHHFTDEVKTETEFGESSSKPFDWSKIYPIDWEIENAETSSAAVSQTTEDDSFFDSKDEFVSTVKKYESGVDYYTSNLLFLRMKFVELNAKFNKTIGMNLISGSDDVLYLADGNLTYYPYNSDMTKSAQNIADFADYSEQFGCKFLYVQAPSKIDPDNNTLPGGIVDYDNIKADSVIKTLDENGIEYLDLRQSMKRQNMNFSEAFYRTDHHWKAQTGLWASDQIAKRINEFGFSYDESKLNISSYNEQVFEKYMLGSLGRKVSLAYAEPEDISIFTPKFSTDYYVRYNDQMRFEGTFEDTMIDMSALDKIDYYNKSPYSAYFHGVSMFSSVENRMADNDCRILFIGDSFSSSVIPFLSTQVRYIDRIDLRYYNGGVRSYVEKNKPDMIIMMYYPGALTESSDSAMHFR